MNALELDTPPELIIIREQPHPLEDIIQEAAEDNDNAQIMRIFTELYKEGKINEIENILTRHLFNEDQTANAIEKIARDAIEPDKD